MQAISQAVVILRISRKWTPSVGAHFTYVFSVFLHQDVRHYLHRARAEQHQNYRPEIYVKLPVCVRSSGWFPNNVCQTFLW